MQLTKEERTAIDNLTRSAKEARKLEHGDLIDWYRQELQRIDQRANRSSQQVRETLKWSLPFLRDVIAGRVEPVRPPPAPARSSRLMDVVGVEPKRPTLSLGNGHVAA